MTADGAATVTSATGRRVEVHGRVIRADGRVEELGLLAGCETDGTPMTPDPRPVGVAHAAAVAWVETALMSLLGELGYEGAVAFRARAIVDELFRYGPIVPDGTPDARTSLGGEA